VIHAVADSGYEAVEWSPREDFLPVGRPPVATRDNVNKLKRLAAERGVRIASIACFYDWSSPDPATRAAAAGDLRRALEVADQLECRHLNTELKGDPREPAASEAAFLDSLAEVLPVAERYQIRISVEPHPYDFLESSDQAVDLVRTVGSPWLGYLLCAPHAFVMGTNVRTMVTYAGRSITHVHLADSFRPSQYILNPPSSGIRVHQHLDVGRGELDWTEFFGGLRETGYAGVLTVAVFAHPDRAIESFTANRSAVSSYLRDWSKPA
jgi:myo-inositol catabolism protein IolH